jgi:metabotropic glutamate receptor 2/3
MVVMCAGQAMSSEAELWEYEASEDNTVRIGGLFAVHGKRDGACDPLSISSGPFANVEAMIFAVNYINNLPDVLPNVTLSYAIHDTCGLTNVAVEKTVGLMEPYRTLDNSSIGISGVVGAALSDVSKSVASLLRVFKVPQISHSSTAAFLSNKMLFDYFFRTIPPDSFQVKAMADLIVHFNWTYIIGIHSDDSYGRGGMSGLKGALNNNNNSRNICVLSQDGITNVPLNADKSYYQGLVEYINRTWIRNATVVVLFGQRQISEDLFDFMLNSAVTFDHLTWIASDAWATRVNPLHKHLVRGMLGLVPQVLHVPEFDKYFKSLTPSNSSNNRWFDEYWQSIFMCSLTETENLCNSSLRLNHTDDSTGNGVAYVLEAVYTFAFTIHGLINKVCPNSSGLLCPELLVRRFDGSALNGTMMRDFIYNVTVPGPTNESITFDRELAGDQPGFYQVTNLGNSGHRTVGTWDIENRLQFTDDIEWREGMDEAPKSICSERCRDGEEPQLIEGQSDCCHTCKRCSGENMVSTGEMCKQCELGTTPNEDNNTCVLNTVTFLRWSSPWAIVLLIVAIIGLLATALVATIFVIFNKEKIIKATSRELSAILLTGIALCYLIPFFFIAEPSPAICAVRRFSIGFCFSLCFSPLLMKTNRIYRVFHTAPHTPRFAGPWSQVVFSSILVSVQIAIAGIWLGIERPSVKLVNGTKKTEKICGESPYVGLPVSLLYSLMLLVLTTFYAFLAREIPAKFNETKFIAATLYSICIIWLGFFPTYFATIKLNLSTVYQTSTLVFTVLLSASTTLACLFLPKVILVLVKLLKEKKSDDRGGMTSTGISTTDLGLGTTEDNYSLGLDRSASNYTL